MGAWYIQDPIKPDVVICWVQMRDEESSIRNNRAVRLTLLRAGYRTFRVLIPGTKPLIGQLLLTM